MLPITKIRQIGSRLAAMLTDNEAVRLGESAVISKRVHMISVNQPQEVKVLAADAGQTFYGRKMRNTIFHLDVFHQVGAVNHRTVAQAIINGVKDQGLPAIDLLDRMDIQTATGGGRISGSLLFGRKQSVRRAHANHVHLALELLPTELPLLVPIVLALEREIMEQGLEIRKVEKVALHLQGNSNAKTDLSAYTAESDSFLREQGSGRETGASENADLLETAHRLSVDTLPPTELLHLLSLCPLQSDVGLRQRWGELDRILETLSVSGYMEKRGKKWHLTHKGLQLLSLVRLHLPELESKLRRYLRRLPSRSGNPKGSFYTSLGPGFLRLRESTGTTEDSEDGQLNLTATAATAACHWIQGESRPGCIHYRCWRYSRRLKSQGANIVLVLDSSASMSGGRLRAAQFLAQHLVLSVKDKVAVIAFQGESIFVPPRFTSSWSDIQQQLLMLKAFGLTPLARALQETLSFVQRYRARRPLVILITDGIPTVPLAGGDPSADALKMAAGFRFAPAELVCIGLSPNQSFLEKLKQVSGGRLYIIKELDTPLLAQLIREELRRHRSH
jgi:magnesium chelatase subunit D